MSLNIASKSLSIKMQIPNNESERRRKKTEDARLSGVKVLDFAFRQFLNFSSQALMMCARG